MANSNEIIDPGAKLLFQDSVLPRLFVLLAIFSVFYFVKLTSFSLSIDDEIEATRADVSTWIAQGRWTIYLWQTFIMPRPVLPFLPIFLFGLFLACGYLLLLECFRSSKITYAHFYAFALFCGFPIWYFLVAFQANTPPEGLGVLVACLSVLMLGHSIDNKERVGLRSGATLAWAGAAGGLGAVAVGAYQSNLMLMGVLGVALVIWKSRAHRGTDVSGLVRSLLLVLLMLVVCLGAYSFILWLFQSSLHIRTSYVDKFLDPSILYHQPFLVISQTLGEMLRVYLGFASVYGVPAYGFGLIIVAGLLGLYSWNLPSWQVRGVLILLALTILFIPFALNFISAFPGHLPYRTLVAVPAAIWFFALLAFTAQWRWLVRITHLIFAVSVFHMLYVGNLFEAASAFVRQHDLVTAAGIYDRIAGANQDFDRTRIYKVDFIGYWTFSSVYPRASSSTIGVSFFEWDNGNPVRILAYMRLLGYENLQQIDLDQRKPLEPVIARMPVWPAPGSVRTEGDVTLVKLGPS